MPVPDYETLMLPLLQLANDQKEHALSEAYNILAIQFDLTEPERMDMLPSGRQPRFENRIGWARTYLKKAGLIDSAGRGRFRITPRGINVLKSKPERITKEFLTQFPEFLEFQARQTTKSENGEETSEHERTPDEVLDLAYQFLRRTLAQDLLERIKNGSPRFFERVVVDLLLAMGYGGSGFDAGKIVGKSGDGGIDGIINEDKLGLDAIYVQAKRWSGTVERPTVQEFAGSLAGLRARKGVLITTSQFSAGAHSFAERLLEMKIVLIDGEQLAQLMIDHGVGVADKQVYALKRIDEDYFAEE